MTAGVGEVLLVVVQVGLTVLLCACYEALTGEWALLGAAAVLLSVWLSVAFGTWLGQFL